MARKMIDLRKLTLAKKKEFRDKYDAYFFDMDGCLVELEGPAIKGASQAIDEIKKNGQAVHVITDNCLNTLKSISSRVHKLFPAIEEENIYNTTYFLCQYLKEIKFKQKIYVIGVEGIISDLKKFGYDVVNDDRSVVTNIEGLITRIERRDTGVGAVVVASDYNYNYAKMTKAVNYLVSDPEVLLFQTYYPAIAMSRPVLPGVGALILPIMAASGRKKSICSGKGSEISVKFMKSLGYKMERSIFIGDGLANDAYHGNMCGMDTMLVLSGASTLDDVENSKNTNNEVYIPKYYTDSVADLLEIFK